jgi:hypothetical protein
VGGAGIMVMAYELDGGGERQREQDGDRDGDKARWR